MHVQRYLLLIQSPTFSKLEGMGKGMDGRWQFIGKLQTIYFVLLIESLLLHHFTDAGYLLISSYVAKLRVG